MKRFATSALLALFLSGCANLTPTQEKILAVSASIIVVGAIYAYQRDGHGAHAPSCPHNAFDCQPVR